MTPVQHKVLTVQSGSGELLVQAKTGTGKTIAFLLPTLQALLASDPIPNGQVAILILSPTRELALQIAKECNQLTARLPRPIECHTAIGGTTRASSLAKFMKGDPTVLVATPGRLNDYVGEARVRAKFKNLRTLILDEADRMLDQGFIGDIIQILKNLPPKSAGWKGMCFSATIPPRVKEVVETVLNPAYTHLSTVDTNEPPTIASVPQYLVQIPHIKDTFTMLFALIKQECAASPTNFKTIIFGTTANGVALLYAIFSQVAESLLPGLEVYQLHSRLSQNIRTKTTDQFKQATSGLMFASDVIGRGMDFPNVGLVIQVGLPADGEQYIHRVGRTARAGNNGRAVIMLTGAETFFLKVYKTLPIVPYPNDITPDAVASTSIMEGALERVDAGVKSKAYQAFLGFHKTFMKKLRTDSVGLVAMANLYAEAMCCPEPPMIDKKIIGKMGLKGVKGLRVGTVERQGPSKRKPTDSARTDEAKRPGPKQADGAEEGQLAYERTLKPSATSNGEPRNRPSTRGAGRRSHRR